MKQTTLGQIPDGGKFKLSKYSKVWYKRIRKEDDGGITITSLASERSPNKKASTKVFVQKQG